MMIFAACLLLASCSQPIENEEEAVLKVAVHDETYKEELSALWNKTYPDTTLEISVISEEDISQKIMNHETIEYDIYWVEDEYIPMIIDDLMEVDDHVEVKLNKNFNEVFDQFKKVYQPIMAQGYAYYMLDLNKIEKDSISIDTFDTIEKVSELDHGFYSLDDLFYTSAFMTSNLNYFPGKEKTVINFTGESFREMLKDYRTILDLIPMNDPTSYDNWFILDSYYSGFVNDDMQLKQDEEVNNGRYQITKLPTINGHQLYTRAKSYGYVINKETAYPNASKNLLKLMHSVDGMQLLCDNDVLIPLIMEDQLDEFTFNNIHVKEKALTLNYAISRNWIGISNKTGGAIDYLFLDETISKLKVCDLEEIENCQKELDEEYQEWLK